MLSSVSRMSDRKSIKGWGMLTAPDTGEGNDSQSAVSRGRLRQDDGGARPTLMVEEGGIFFKECCDL